MTGLATGMPAKPCVTNSQRLNTSWMITAKASVAMARYMPVIRSAGKPTTRPLAVVISTARTSDTTQGMPCCRKKAWA